MEVVMEDAATFEAQGNARKEVRSQVLMTTTGKRCTVWDMTTCSRITSQFWRNILSPSSGMKNEPRKQLR
jgi:hypothetical protein